MSRLDIKNEALRAKVLEFSQHIVDDVMVTDESDPCLFGVLCMLNVGIVTDSMQGLISTLKPYHRAAKDWSEGAQNDE